MIKIDNGLLGLSILYAFDGCLFLNTGWWFAIPWFMMALLFLYVALTNQKKPGETPDLRQPG